MRREDLSEAARDRFDMWHSTIGLSESAALAAVVADGLVELDGFDRAVLAFVESGLPLKRARVAAIGHAPNESAARREWAAAVSGKPAEARRVERLQEQLDRMSDAEVALLEAATRRRRSASGSASTGKRPRPAPAKKSAAPASGRVPISETNR